jgi:hypothetical protein
MSNKTRKKIRIDPNLIKKALGGIAESLKEFREGGAFPSHKELTP